MHLVPDWSVAAVCPLLPRYGLSREELQDVEEQLQELAAARAADGGGADAGGAAALAEAGGAGGRAQREAELLGVWHVGGFVQAVV